MPWATAAVLSEAPQLPKSVIAALAEKASVSAASVVPARSRLIGFIHTLLALELDDKRCRCVVAAGSAWLWERREPRCWGGWRAAESQRPPCPARRAREGAKRSAEPCSTKASPAKPQPSVARLYQMAWP